MKTLLVLLSVAGFLFASDMIPFDQVETVAYGLANQHFGTRYLEKTVTYYGIDHEPSAYALTYQGVVHGDPVTIVMGARYTITPVNEMIRGIPRSQEAFDLITDRARLLGRGEPEFLRIYYFGPGEEYCAFMVDGQEYLVHAGDLRAYSGDRFFSHLPEKNEKLERLTREKWDVYLNTTNYGIRQDSTYIPNVPFIDWTYGCSPTAASMILWYWDQYAPSPLYGKLVDYFFTRWELLYGQYKDQANVNRELALSMYTDSTTGGTSISMIRYGIEAVCNTQHGYSFSVQLSPQGYSSNQYVFSWLKDELTVNRPAHWNVLYYYYGGDFINHSIVAVGYQIQPPDTFIQIHTTWGWSGEPLWPLWTYHNGTYSYDYVIKVIPGGGITDNLFLDFPRGGFVFKGLKYKIRWTDIGSNIDHLKLWWAIGNKAMSYDSTYWTLIAGNAPNTGEYIWTAPNQDSALRVNIAGYNSSNQRLAADGHLTKTQCAFPDHSSNLALVGHFASANAAADIEIQGDYAFICNGANGLYVADISDSSLPDVVTHLALPGTNTAMVKSGSYLYLADQADTLRVISIANPTSPSQVAKLALTADQPRGIALSGNYVYVACRGTGIMIVNVSTPTSPTLAGSYDTPGQAYDVFVVDTLAYVADGTRGLRILNVSDPGNVTEIGFIDTNGISQGLDVVGTTLYLAEGGQGIKVINVSDPANPVELGSLGSGGTAMNVFMTDSLLVANGSSGLLVVDVSDPANPVQAGYLSSFGSSSNLCHVGSLIYLADQGDGMYVIHEDLPTGVTEYKDGTPHISSVTMATPQKGLIQLSIVLSHVQDITITVYDVTGRVHTTLKRDQLAAGEHEFNVSPNAAGVYFVRVTGNEQTVAKKVVFVK
jgi:hypothetical protein